MTEELFIVLALACVIGYLLLTSGDGSVRVCPRVRDLEELREQTAREMVRAEERHRQWVHEAFQRNRER
jgi:hypothetical protein